MGDEAVLFCSARNQLFYLNQTATYIWCALLEGFSQTEITKSLATRFRTTQRIARRDMEMVLSTWAGAGLPVAETPDPKTGQQPLESDAGPLLAQWPGPPQAGATASNLVLPRSHLYRLDKVLFRIRFAAANDQACVHPPLAHLQIKRTKIRAESIVTIEISPEGGKYRLSLQGQLQGGPLAVAELVPQIHRIMLTAAYRSSNCLAGFHAGAIASEKGSLLFPGAPGAGKSTLIASLVNAGYRYLTDELVLLTRDFRLRPMSISLGLKRGSWPLLSPATLPASGLTIHRQADGTAVRFLTPPPPRSSSYPPLRALVFPRYSPNTSGRLNPLSPATALYRLAESGYTVPGGLNQKVVKTLVRWVSRHQSFELAVNDLNTATTEIGKLLV